MNPQMMISRGAKLEIFEDEIQRILCDLSLFVIVKTKNVEQNTSTNSTNIGVICVLG